MLLGVVRNAVTSEILSKDTEAVFENLDVIETEVKEV